MKRLSGVVVGAILALAVTVGGVRAQTALIVGTGVGGSLPVGNLGDIAGIGWNAQANLGLQNPTWPVGLRFDVMYHSLGLDDEFGDGDIEIIAGIANAELYVARSPSGGGLFLVGGAGIYNQDFGQDGDDEDGESTTDFGLLVGGGYKLAMTNLMLSLEAKFHNIFTEIESTQLIPFDVVVEIPLGGR